MTWELSQSASAVSGPVVARDEAGLPAYSGTLAGTVSGTTLTFTIEMPEGSVSAFPACRATLSGTAAISGSALSGTYAGTNSCTQTFNNGQLNLSKQ